MHKFLWCHNTIALEDPAILHYKLNLAQRINLFERIAFDGNEVGRETNLNRSAGSLRFAAFISIDSHGAQDILGRQGVHRLLTHQATFRDPMGEGTWVRLGANPASVRKFASSA